jgi:hypothetical protein
VEATYDKLASAEDVQKESKFLGMPADTFRTPGKQKRDLDESQGPARGLGKIKFEKYVRDLPKEPKELEGEDCVLLWYYEKGTITSIVSGLETHMVLVGDCLVKEVASLTATRFEDNEETLEIVFGLVGNVRAGIGSPNALPSSFFMAPTIWGTILFMAYKEVVRVGSSLKRLTGIINPFQVSSTQELWGIM